jgi:hypothetical protein
MGGTHVEAEEEKRKNWQEETRLVKDRKAFPIWLKRQQENKRNRKKQSITFIRC